MSESILAQWRARLGWNQRKAASELGVFLSTYQQWESGISRQTGKPVAAPKVAELAASALEAGLPPIAPN